MYGVTLYKKITLIAQMNMCTVLYLGRRVQGYFPTKAYLWCLSNRILWTHVCSEMTYDPLYSLYSCALAVPSGSPYSNVPWITHHLKVLAPLPTTCTLYSVLTVTSMHDVWYYSLAAFIVHFHWTFSQTERQEAELDSLPQTMPETMPELETTSVEWYQCESIVAMDRKGHL